MRCRKCIFYYEEDRKPKCVLHINTKKICRDFTPIEAPTKPTKQKWKRK